MDIDLRTLGTGAALAFALWMWTKARRQERAGLALLDMSTTALLERGGVDEDGKACDLPAAGDVYEDDDGARYQRTAPGRWVRL